jgi:hypothetical protein
VKNINEQANYINALAVSVSPFFEPAMPIALGGLCVTLGGFVYDIGWLLFNRFFVYFQCNDC